MNECVYQITRAGRGAGRPISAPHGRVFLGPLEPDQEKGKTALAEILIWPQREKIEFVGSSIGALISPVVIISTFRQGGGRRQLRPRLMEVRKRNEDHSRQLKKVLEDFLKGLNILNCLQEDILKD